MNSQFHLLMIQNKLTAILRAVAFPLQLQLNVLNHLFTTNLSSRCSGNTLVSTIACIALRHVSELDMGTSTINVDCICIGDRFM